MDKWATPGTASKAIGPQKIKNLLSRRKFFQFSGYGSIKALASAGAVIKRRRKKSPIAKNPNDLANAYICF